MAANAKPTQSQQHQPLTTTREERGRQIAKRGGIRQRGARYVVPSQSSGTSYVVDVVAQTCTCADHAERGALGVTCKHQEGVLFWLAWEGAVNDQTGEVTPPPAKKKQQSKQNWPAYNRAQTTERPRIARMLYTLCLGILDAERVVGTPGQKPIRTREGIFGVVAKVLSGCSGRVAEGDLHAHVKSGYLSRAWDANTLFRVMEDPATTSILTWLVEQSAGPIAQVENAAGQFAVDSTGFRTTVRRLRDEKEAVVTRWFDQKHTLPEHRRQMYLHDWVKLHAMVGTLTNIVTAGHVTAGTGVGSGDSPHFIPLLNTTAQRFVVKQVSGDKGYLDEDNLSAAAAVGARPFVPFKDNSRGMDHPNEEWRKMWAYSDLKKKSFMAAYGRRQNIEASFGAIKAKYGDSVRSKKLVAQQNEVLAKVVLWNLSCIVHAIEEFGVEAEFSQLVMP